MGGVPELGTIFSISGTEEQWTRTGRMSLLLCVLTIGVFPGLGFGLTDTMGGEGDVIESGENVGDDEDEDF